MDDIHLSREILRAVENGTLPRSVLEEIKTEHLLGRCPHCRAEVEAYERERDAKASVLQQVFQILSVYFERLVALGSRDSTRAKRDLLELLPLSQDERMRRVERARGRFRSPTLVKLLLEESHRSIPREPPRAFQLAELARRIANRNPRTPSYFGRAVISRRQTNSSSWCVRSSQSTE